MWLATHMLSGGLIFDSVKSEPPWLRWPLFTSASFVFHLVLDSTPVYHNMTWPWAWWQWGIALWNAITVILFLWQFDNPHPRGKWLLKVFAKRMFIGGFAWLAIDGFWLYRPWGMWLHGLLPNIGRWPDPQSSIAELAFMGLLLLLGWQQIVKRKARGGDKWQFPKPISEVVE